MSSNPSEHSDGAAGFVVAKTLIDETRVSGEADGDDPLLQAAVESRDGGCFDEARVSGDVNRVAVNELVGGSIESFRAVDVVGVSGVEDLTREFSVAISELLGGNVESVPNSEISGGEMVSNEVDAEKRMGLNAEGFNNCGRDTSQLVLKVSQNEERVEIEVVKELSSIVMNEMLEGQSLGGFEVELEVHQDEELGQMAGVDVTSSALTTETFAEQTQGMVEEEVVPMDGEEGVGAKFEESEINVVDSAYMLGTGTQKSLQQQEIFPEGDTLTQDIEPKKAGSIVETTSNPVNLEVPSAICHASKAKLHTENVLQIGSKIPMQGVIRGEVAVVDVEEDPTSTSRGLEINAVDVWGGSPKSLQNQDVSLAEDASMQDVETDGAVLEPETSSASHASEDRNQAEMQVVKVGGLKSVAPMLMQRSDASIEQIHSVVRLEDASMDVGENSNETYDVSETSAICSTSVLCGSPKSCQYQDISRRKDTSIQDMEPKKIAPTAETTYIQQESEVTAIRCHASADEVRETEFEIVNKGSSVSIMKSSVEQVQLVFGGEAPVRDSEEVSKISYGISESNADSQGRKLGSFSYVDICPLGYSSKHNVEPVAPLAEITFDLADPGVPSTRCIASEYEEQKAGIELIKEASSISLARSALEQIQTVAGEKIVVMDGEVLKKDEDSGIDAMDPNQVLGKCGSLESLSHEDVLCSKNASMQDIEPEKVPPPAEATSNLVKDKELAHPIQEKLNEKASVIVSTSLTEVARGSKSMGSCISPHGENGPGSTRVAECVRPSAELLNEGACVRVNSEAVVFCASLSKADPNSSRITNFVGLDNQNVGVELQMAEDHASVDEHMQAGIEVLNVTSATVSTEQFQVVTGNEIAAVGEEEVPKRQDEVLGTDFSKERNHVLSPEVVSLGSESLANGDLTESVYTYAEDQKQAMVAQVAETVFLVGGERTDTHQNLDESIVNSNSLNKAVDGSQATCACVSLCGDTDTDFAQAAETLAVPPDAHLDSEVQLTEGHASLLDKDQTMGIHVPETCTYDVQMNSTVEIGETQLASVFSQVVGNQVEDQTMGSDGSELGISQVNSNLMIMSGIDESLDTCCHTNGKWNTGDEFIDQDTSPADEAYGELARINDTLPLSDHLDVNAAEQDNVLSDYDLVWGKVKSHPWWPGQIFHASDASERAKKYQKKDRILVAYFGDQTFAWNEASSLKPFRAHFSEMEKQSSLESFRSAVNFALDEVSRRVEFGMTCSCTPKEAYAKVKSQIIENAGLRKKARGRDGMDNSMGVYSFEPDKLVQNIKALALIPRVGGDRLELAVTQAQLAAFYCLKGYPQPPELHVYGGLVEDDVVLSGETKHPQDMAVCGTPVSQDAEQLPSGKEKLKGQYSPSRKRKCISDDGVRCSRKERSLSELMSAEKASKHLVDGEKFGKGNKSTSASGKKRKALDSFSDDTGVKSRQYLLSPSRGADTPSPATQSFKVGDCIRRVASQLTGISPIVKCSGERLQKSAPKVDQSIDELDVAGSSLPTPVELHSGRILIPNECSSPEENLSQLCLAARDPRKRYSFLTRIIDYFTGFRNSISLESSSREKQKSQKMSGGSRTLSGNRKPSNIETNSNKTFDFEDMSDTYWTDRIIQSSPEEQPSRRNRKTAVASQIETQMGIGGPSVELERLLRDPALDLEYQNLDGDLDILKEKPKRKYRRKRESELVLPMYGDVSLGSKTHSVGGGNYVENAEYNLNKDNYVDEFCPTALLMSFTEADSVPSAVKLNRTFNRFGPLKESETEVMAATKSARVVFKKRTDAEVALSSAVKFRIFGQTLVNYQLSCLSSTTCKAYSDPATQVRKDATHVQSSGIGYLEGNTNGSPEY